jgi:hypothetical protein
MSQESYKHLFAKRLVIQWLRDQARPVRLEADGDTLLIDLSPVRALTSASDPYRGVYEEYPVCLTASGTTTIHQPWQGGIPTYEELVARGQRPAYIFDIAVAHLGQIKYALEIVHRHPVSHTKIHMLRVATYPEPFELYSLDADWVLNQCRPPACLEVQRLLPLKIKSPS